MSDQANNVAVLSHPNGDCRNCGAPCAVYGCRYCPTCYQPAMMLERLDREAVALGAMSINDYRRAHRAAAKG